MIVFLRIEMYRYCINIFISSTKFKKIIYDEQGLPQAEAFAVLDGLTKLLTELLFAVIVRQQQVRVAHMSRWQKFGRITVSNDSETKAAKTAKRDAIAARDERKELFLLFVREGFDHSPEGLDRLMVLRVARTVLCRALKLIKVHFVGTDDHDLEFLGTEELQST